MKKEKGCVYFFRHRTTTPIKIGYSSDDNPLNRFDSFKTYAPYGAELLGFISTYEARKLEDTLHKKYHLKRLKGEWFEITINDVKNDIEFYSDDSDLIERSEFEVAFAKSKEELTKELNNFFIDWMDSNLSCNILINRKDLKEAYLKKAGVDLSSQLFNKQVKRFCERFNYIFSEKKSNGVIHFFITQKQQTNES